MAQHMLTPPDLSFTDKRKKGTDDADSHLVGPVVFTANANGTTTTIVGADATLATGVNVVRVGERIKLFNSSGKSKQESVHTVTSVASSAGSTTVTFSPAAAVATASGDTARCIKGEDNNSLDARLKKINSTLYTQSVLDKMTQNDKVYAIRLADDLESF